MFMIRNLISLVVMEIVKCKVMDDNKYPQTGFAISIPKHE
jgi:hypothetical protein